MNGGAALLGIVDGVGFGVRMTVAVTVSSVSVVVEEEEADNVGGEAQTYYQYKSGVADFLRFDKSLDGFEEDGETQSDKEDSVDKRSQGFGALPLTMCEFVFEK